MYLLIIHDLNVTLKSVAYVMNPPKRYVVNITLDGSMKYPCLLHNTPLSDQLDFANVDMRKMITCPTEALICGNICNLLKLKESVVQLHNESSTTADCNMSRYNCLLPTP